MKTLLRRTIAVVLALAGGVLCYFGGWLVQNAILPQVRESGWSLRGDSMILNREWHGNQLYLVVAVYWILGIAFVLASMALWRRGWRSRR